jgi:two-component system chemotaxis response regulator CheY
MNRIIWQSFFNEEMLIVKALIVEDDFASRVIIQELLRDFGLTDVAHNGQEAVEAMRVALSTGQYYDLICLDIMMPDLDGQQTLSVIREMEMDRGILPSQGVKIIMTTAYDDIENIIGAYFGRCDGFLSKPILKKKFLNELSKLGLISGF